MLLIVIVLYTSIIHTNNVCAGFFLSLALKYAVAVLAPEPTYIKADSQEKLVERINDLVHSFGLGCLQNVRSF